MLVQSATAVGSAGRGPRLRKALILTTIAVLLASPVVVAQQERDEQERRRQIPVRLVRPSESATGGAPAPRRNIPVRMVRAGEAGSVSVPSAPPVGSSDATDPSADGSNGGAAGASSSAAIAPASAPAAELPLDGKRIVATWTDTPPVLDGRIDDGPWDLADVVSDFLQKDPVAGSPPGKRTEARILYDDDHPLHRLDSLRR